MNARMTRRNTRSQRCEDCGVLVAAGEGSLTQGWDDEEDEPRGWEVRCLDAAACNERRAVAKARYEVQRAVQRAAHQAVAALEARFRAGTYPTGMFSPRGDEIPMGGGDRIYGGGRWAVIEAAGERTAPDPGEIAAVRAEHDRRVAALQVVIATLTAWTAENLPADAPSRRCNGGRPPHGGQLYGKDLESLSVPQRAEYDARLRECQRLSYTASEDSYHASAQRLRELEQAAQVATYPRAIWWVQNNGHDGDCWDHNNVRTGGAGAIGCYLPWTAELEAEVRAVAEGLRALQEGA